MSVTTGAADHLSNELFSKMSSYRHKVFNEILKWDLDSTNGQELDQFDRPDTVYLISQDDLGQVNGCARLLPTNNPYLLGDVFPELMNGLPLPNSPDIWELSRFAAVDFNQNASSAMWQYSSDIMIDLLHEAIACAAARGAKRIIAVSSIGAERLLRKRGFHIHRAGAPKVIGGHPIFAFWIEIPENLKT